MKKKQCGYVRNLIFCTYSRVIGQAATCIERSLGMKFSMENLRLSSMDDDLDEEAMDTNATTPPLNANENRRNARLRRSRKGKTIDIEIPNSSQFTKDLVRIFQDQKNDHKCL